MKQESNMTRLNYQVSFKCITHKFSKPIKFFVKSLSSNTNLYCLLDKDMISKMLERLEKLLNGVAVQRALSVHSIDHNEVVRLAELRVVRECNLPDSYTSFLDVSYVSLILHN